jgi:tetratricopeptide (TPR) repeat protein
LSLPAPGTLEALREATADIRRHDRAEDWTDAECDRIGHRLAEVPKDGRPLADALYDAFVTFGRCGKGVLASEALRGALAADPRFVPARVASAVERYEAGGDIDTAVAALEAAVLDSQFQSAEAQVSLARLERRRGDSGSGYDCSIPTTGKAATDALDCARMDATRALAVDPSSGPALNQLALTYVARARRRGPRAGERTIALALLVVQEGLTRYPKYAPLHLTTGLALAAKGDSGGAIAAFDRARTIDASSFEAQMDYAGTALLAHDFTRAEEGYEKAVALRPSDYGAHLGLAVALRGLIVDANFDAQVSRVKSELDACMKIDSTRPDAYYNAAILTHEFTALAGGGTDATIAALRTAKLLLQVFQARAGSKAEYAAAEARARQRMQDIDDLLAFLGPHVLVPAPRVPARP